MTLSIVATPIGNLEDVSPRALRTLAEADVILCEDTRVTGHLLARYSIVRPLLSYHAQSLERRTYEIIELLRSGKNLALVSDAGTPGINDPGGKLVERAVREFGDEITIVPIPGPSSPIAALSVSGFPTDRYRYLGFPPHKKGREKFFDIVASSDETVVFLESTHRIMKAMESLSKRLPERAIMVGRELTKKFETIYRGTPSEVTSALKASTIKGEFVVVVRKP